MKAQNFLYPGLLMLLLAVSTQAQAAPLDSAGLLDDILSRFSNVASTWSTVIQNYATWIFWSLVLMSMVWTFGMMALQGEGGITSALAEIVRFFAVTGFFFYLLKNGPAISISIQDSLRQLASNASGMPKTFSPSGIVDIGFDIVSQVVDQSSIWSPTDSMVGLLLAGVILCILALVGINMLILLIAGWILSYAGIFLLGFGGGRWTSDIAINYFKTVLGVGLQLFTMVLLVGISKSFIDQYYHAMGGNVIQLKSMFVILVASMVLLVLVNKVPPMIGSISGGVSVGGIGGFGTGLLTGSAATATAAIATAGAAVATAGSAIAAAGSTHTTGGASELKAAFESAQAAMSEGSGSIIGSSGMGGEGAYKGTSSVTPVGGSSSLLSSGGAGSSNSRDLSSAEGSGSSNSGGLSPAGAAAGGSSGPSQGFMSFSKAGHMASHMASSLTDSMAGRQAAKDDSKVQSAKEQTGETASGQLTSQTPQQMAERTKIAASASQGYAAACDTGSVRQIVNDSQTCHSVDGDSLAGSQQKETETENSGQYNE